MLILAAFVVPAAPVHAQQEYPQGPDSTVQPVCRKAKCSSSALSNRRFFQATVRDYWIYVPAQYTPDKLPVCM